MAALSLPCISLIRSAGSPRPRMKVAISLEDITPYVRSGLKSAHALMTYCNWHMRTQHSGTYEGFSGESSRCFYFGKGNFDTDISLSSLLS